MRFRSTIVVVILVGVAITLAAAQLCIVTSALNPVLPQQAGQASEALKRGRHLLKRGHADQALPELQLALNLYTTAKNNGGIAAAHNELGDLYLRQGQYPVALDHYEKALDGFLAGDKAEQAVNAAVGLADDKFNANLMLAKIGDVNFRLGKNSEAIAAYDRMVVKKPEGAAAKVGRRFGGLGGIVGSISTGNVSVAAPTSALTVALEAKKEFDEYRISIVYSSYELGMGRLAYVANDLETARKHFQNALEATSSSIAGIAKLGQTLRYRAAARTSLGDVALRQGKLKDASKFYADAVKGAQEDKRLDLMWPAQRGLGRSLWLQAVQEKDVKKANSLRDSALGNYRDSIATIETLRQGSLRADEARTTFLASIKDVFDEACTAYAEMALLTDSSGGALQGKALDYASQGFKISEESRARSLLDLLSETNAVITEGVPVELLKRKEDNLDRQQEIAELLTGVNISTDEAKKKPAELDAELEKLQSEYEEIENQIRTASARYASLTANQPLSLVELQQRVVDEHTVALEYSLQPDASYLWVVSNKAANLYKIPGRSTVEQLTSDLRSQLIPSRLQRRIVGIDVAADQARGLGIAATAPEDAAKFITASNALYKAVLEPAASLFTDKRLLVIADGALNYVPFEALLKTTDAGDFASLPYLVKSNEIIYSPSASVVAAIRQQRTKSAGRSMLVVADPVFNSNDTRAHNVAANTASADVRGLGIQSALSDVAGQESIAATQSGKMDGLPLARLVGTRTEAEQISKLAKGSGAQADVWLDLDASEDNVDTRDLTKYRVIHVATHGLLDVERPQFTGLILSLVGNKTQDGFLRTDKVFNLRLGGPLVMLSACETGLGKEKRGEGVMGLTRAFMYAGAPTVGVSLWSVADKSTADLMADFYRRLLAKDDTSPSTALREAQLAMISGKKFSAPFYWAPFVLVGDWN
ncbi:MAG: CHAT domain-containing protein [Pyrinomonadaceae bacterium]